MSDFVGGRGRPRRSRKPNALDHVVDVLSNRRRLVRSGILSRRTLATLAVSFGLLAMLGFTMSGRVAADGANRAARKRGDLVERAWQSSSSAAQIAVGPQA